MLFVSFRYHAKDGPYTVTDTDSTVLDIDEPECAEDIDELERYVATHIHRMTGCSAVTSSILYWTPLRKQPSRVEELHAEVEKVFGKDDLRSAISVLCGQAYLQASQAGHDMFMDDIIKLVEDRKVASIVQRVHKIGWLNEAERKKLINWLS